MEICTNVVEFQPTLAFHYFISSGFGKLVSHALIFTANHYISIDKNQHRKCINEYCVHKVGILFCNTRRLGQKKKMFSMVVRYCKTQTPHKF